MTNDNPVSSELTASKNPALPEYESGVSARPRKLLPVFATPNADCAVASARLA